MALVLPGGWMQAAGVVENFRLGGTGRWSIELLANPPLYPTHIMIDPYFLGATDDPGRQTHLFVDDLAVPVSWQGRDLAPLVGRKVYLRFFLRNRFLFGFRFDG